MQLKKTHQFQKIASFVKPDSKKRISVGKALMGADVHYDIYVNSIGEIMLEPVESIPVQETWLLKNKSALNSIQKGLLESEAKDVSHQGSFAKYIEEDQ